MIELFPPQGHVPLSKIKLNTGATVFPNLLDHGRVRVLDEEDAEELERRGWKRDVHSANAKAAASDLLQKGFAASLKQRDPHSIGGADPHPRTEFGTVETREHGPLVIAHERANNGGSLIIH